jgi:uncharacterized protein (TIGR02611 family)
VTARLRAVRARVHALPAGRFAWRLGVTFVGAAIVVVGVVLLPLPGPGWLIIFAGLGVLATEYVWAHRLLGRARALVAGWTRWVLRRGWWARALITVVGLVVLVALVAGAWQVYRLV